MQDPATPSRRRALTIFVTSALGAASAAVATLAGLVIVPRASRAVRRWLTAARFSDLTPGTPTPVVISAATEDGWHRARKPRVVFLVASNDSVHALSATCTHLGCRVAWNQAMDRFECPCHKGAYDRDGRVIAGPPPSPLPPVNARVDLARDEVQVEI